MPFLKGEFILFENIRTQSHADHRHFVPFSITYLMFGIFTTRFSAATKSNESALAKGLLGSEPNNENKKMVTGLDADKVMVQMEWICNANGKTLVA